MASKVQICNLALTKLGANRITSLTDGTEEANLCNLLYDDIAEEVMMEGPWTSTLVRTSLAKTTNTPAYGYTDEFQLPVLPRALKIIQINELQEGDYDYAIEGDKLLANISTMSILYISFVTDTQSYDPMLKRAIVARLAAELAYPLTGKSGVVEQMTALYKEAVDEGLSISTQQGSLQEIVIPTLTTRVR